jgi:hypothetical protein
VLWAGRLASIHVSSCLFPAMLSAVRFQPCFSHLFPANVRCLFPPFCQLFQRSLLLSALDKS